jgi:hypothetical protein
VLQSGPPPARRAAGQALRHWLKDPDLAGARGPAGLPEAERADWRQLWAEVEALVRRAGAEVP